MHDQESAQGEGEKREKREKRERRRETEKDRVREREWGREDRGYQALTWNMGTTGSRASLAPRANEFVVHTENACNTVDLCE
jgi:hypothetical protein